MSTLQWGSTKSYSVLSILLVVKFGEMERDFWKIERNQPRYLVNQLGIFVYVPCLLKPPTQLCQKDPGFGSAGGFFMLEDSFFSTLSHMHTRYEGLL